MMLQRFRKINLLHYSLVTLSLTVLVILWGAYVRATGAGAGCGNHWPLCNGAIVPRQPLEETLVEFTHRISSGLAFLMVLGQWMLARQKFPSGHRVRIFAALALVFMVLEALIGAGLVLFDLVAFNTSIARAVVGALHLLNTFLLLASISLLAASVSQTQDSQLVVTDVRGGLLIAGLLGMLLVGMSGSITALGDTLFPSETFLLGFALDQAPDAHFLIRLRIWHPVVAVLTALLILAGIHLPSTGRTQAPSLQLGLTILVFIQLFAGVINVLLLAPLWLQMIHLLLADLIWIGLIVFINQTQRQ